MSDNYLAESYSSFLVREAKKRASTSSFANIANISFRTASAPKPATWAAQSFYSEGGGGGVPSDEFPTVYGYL